MSADDCFHNNNIIIVIIILVILHIGRKISESCFIFFQKILLVNTIVNIIIKVIMIIT